MHRVKALLTLCALVAVQLGCDHPATNVQAELPTPSTNAAPPVVDLPDPPPASGFIIPEANQDGTLRVVGMVEHKDKHLDKPVTVKGFVASISPDCDPKTAKKKEQECPEPHLIIKDDMDSDRAMLVVGFEPELVKKAKLEVGEQYDFKASYQMMAQGFTATEDGVLLLDEVNGVPAREIKK